MALRCPKCAAEMVTYERSGIHLDQCRECRGIYLDRGELERLVDAESGGAGWAGPRMNPPAPIPLPRAADPRTVARPTGRTRLPGRVVRGRTMHAPGAPRDDARRPRRRPAAWPQRVGRSFVGELLEGFGDLIPIAARAGWHPLRSRAWAGASWGRITRS